MKNFFFAILFCLTASLSAQTFTITGKAIDETGGVLPGANVALQYPWGEVVTVSAAESNGRFFFKNIEPGGYKVEITYLGFENIVQEVTVSDANVDMGNLVLKSGSTTLDEVLVKERMVTATQDGDTTSFNAGAFKVMKDASAEELLEKMPTVSIQNGKIQAQGEDVKQVLVDGKPFFGNDPAAALKNLPAEVIAKIQIYDQASDQSKFTGFDDGNTSKTINIITNTGMNSGQFGKIYGGYGTDEKYQAGGNMNFFNGDQRISVIGMSNNINIQNFSADDILGVMGGGSGGRGGRGGRGGGRPGGSWGRGGSDDFLVNAQNGIARTHAIGLNYADKWGKKWDVSGSYFFNNSNSNSVESLNQQFIDGQGFGEIYSEESVANSKNTNHRLSGQIEIELDSLNSLMIRPNLSLQLNNGQSTTLGQTVFDNNLLGQTDSRYNSDLTGLNFSNNLLWRHKMQKKGRTFSINISNGYAPKKGDSQLLSESVFTTPVAAADTLNQRSDLDVNSWNVKTSFNYTEPITETSQLMVDYEISYQQEDSDKSTFDFSELTNSYSDLNTQFSNVFSNDYTTHRGGIGYNYRPNKDVMIIARARYQYATLNNDQTFPQMLQTGQSFKNFVPFAMLRYNINGREKSLRVFYRTNTNLPSISQLQNVVDNSNPLQLSSGNPNLRQSYSNSMFVRYQATNVSKSRVFYAMLGGTITNDQIANATYFARSDNPIFSELGLDSLSRGTQLTIPVNLDGYRNIRSFITYGVPVSAIKSNFNLDLNYTYTRNPGLIDNEANFSNNHAFGSGLTLSSNISDKIDFALIARPTYNVVKNTLQTTSDTKYYSQDSRIKFNWIIVEGLVLRNELAHQFYSGLSGGFNDSYLIWNFGLGKKIFKNQRGEVTFSVNDLLKQNRSISRTVTETYIQDSRTNALTRFFMLNFTYNLRNFNTGKEKTREEKEMRPPWG
ncbi:MAG: outer membrane beta-barrel protein [Saprospiraceae bacterium]